MTKDEATNKDSLKVEEPAQEPECSNHPDAPHGFCRDASHSAGRYVCECEGWEAEQPAQAKADFDVMAYGQSFMLDGKHIPLSDVYTPPAPSWQGLSDDEIRSFRDVWGTSKMAIDDIEASLKAKNTQ